MTYVRGLCLGMVVMIFGVRPSRADSTGIVIDMIPKFFYPEVTQSVTLSCSMTSEGEKAPAVIAMQIKRSGSSPKNKDAANKNPKGNEKKTVAEENSIKTPEILLAGVTFRGGAKLHVADEDAVKKRLKVEGSMEEQRLVLTIQKPEWEDAGTYTCFATALSLGYKLVDYTASANLTILGDKGSSALLLAKQQVLETHQEQLERQTVILQEEMQHLQHSRQELLDKVHLLENKHEDLNSLFTQFLNSSTSPGSRTDSAQQRSSASKAETTSEFQLEMIQIKSRLDTLQNNVVAQLKSKIQRLDTQISGSVLGQMKSIRQRLQVMEQAKNSKGSSPGTQQGGAGLENLPKVLERLDALEHHVVEEISQKVTRLEQVGVKNIRDRLDKLELHTLKDMDTRVEAEKGVSESNKNHLAKIESDLQALLQKLHRLKTECFVCGNFTTSQQCTLQEARKKLTVKCPLDTGYCMNDIIQDGHGRKIYKRCVSREDCVALTKKSSKRCADFNFMTLGPLECHFCCAYSKCNEEPMPKDLYHF